MCISTKTKNFCLSIIDTDPLLRLHISMDKIIRTKNLLALLKERVSRKKEEEESSQLAFVTAAAAGGALHVCFGKS